MRIDLPIAAYAVAGTGTESAHPERRLRLPPPGTKRQGGRAPLLATALARSTLPEHTDRAEVAVLFGTGLGCLTETQLFVENMIRNSEETPKPRAFSSSVHNAIASKVALEIGAKGECQTFSHGEVSFVHAVMGAGLVRARYPDAPIVVGAVDESNEYVDRGLTWCGATSIGGEGGGVLYCARDAIARLSTVAYARPTDVTRWLDEQTDEKGEGVAIAGMTDDYEDIPGVSLLDWPARHPSAAATATCLAVGILAGEVAPKALDLVTIPDRITLLTLSRFGDCALIQVEAI